MAVRSGNLALSRALGDFEFKQNNALDAEHQVVTADPDIIVHTPTPEDEFVVLACDGIWDVLTSQQVIDFVRRHIALRLELPTICELLMDRCLAPDSDWGGVGCDNMTVMIVALKTEKRTKIEWYNWIGEKIANVDAGTEGGGYSTPKETPDPFAQGSSFVPFPCALFSPCALADIAPQVREETPPWTEERCRGR